MKKLIKVVALYYDRIFSFIVVVISIRHKMEILAIISILIFLLGARRIKEFLEIIMEKIERSKEGSIGMASWKDHIEAAPPYDFNVTERQSGINAFEFNKYFEQGKSALGQGNIPKSKEMFEQALKIDPDNFEVHVSLGLIYNLFGENKKSIEFSRKALEIKPNSFIPQFNLAIATNHYLGSEKSLSEYQKVEKIAQEQNISETITIGKLNLFIGHDYREIGNTVEAKRRYEKAKSIFELYDTPEARFWLKDTLNNIKRLQK